MAQFVTQESDLPRAALNVTELDQRSSDTAPKTISNTNYTKGSKPTDDDTPQATAIQPSSSSSSR
eukprot:scaffold35410_cov233-Skeletonema_dohrnii-CCMP3373.AAC.1